MSDSFMAILDHWHPVLPSRQLRCEPVGVRLAGRCLVLFRDHANRIGALADECPHRRMRLSKGRMENGRLQCPYHGWTFDTTGRGESPGTPRLQAQVISYEVREEYGAIWVKPQGASGSFPVFAVADYRHMGTLVHRMQAPLELALDNFSEIEHTGVVHRTFGFDPDRMAEVQVQVEFTDTSVVCPQRRSAQAACLGNGSAVGRPPPALVLFALDDLVQPGPPDHRPLVGRPGHGARGFGSLAGHRALNTCGAVRDRCLELCLRSFTLAGTWRRPRTFPMADAPPTRRGDSIGRRPCGKPG